MKIEIIKEGIRKEIELKPVKGRHVSKLISKQIELQSTEDKGEKAKEYLDLLNEISSEITGLTLEELEDLDTDDLSKITKYLHEKTHSRMGF